MAVPKKRTSHRRKGMRRSHDGIKFNARVEFCKNCSATKLLHHVCEECGMYRGIQIKKVADAE